MIRPGDIIRHRGALWACMELRPDPRPGFAPMILLGRPGEVFVAGAGDCEFVRRPIFQPGDKVCLGGQPATVLEDAGGGFVAVKTETTVETKRGTRLSLEPSVTHAARAALTRDNAL